MHFLYLRDEKMRLAYSSITYNEFNECATQNKHEKTTIN